jgi:preprotein translocase subunit SecA
MKMLDDTVAINVNMYMSGDIYEDWNLAGLREFYAEWVIKDEGKYIFSENEQYDLDRQYVTNMLVEDARAVYAENETLLPTEVIREMERVYLLKSVDTYWMEHIDNMEQLREGIRLRAYAQRDPVIEYRLEGSDMFDEMIEEIRQNTIKMLLVMPKKVVEMKNKEEALKRKQQATINKTSGDGTATKSAPVRKGKKPGVNDLCPCGSGKKYKKCCKPKFD